MNRLKKIALLLSALILCGCNNSSVEEVTGTSAQTEAASQTTSAKLTEAVTDETEKSPADLLPMMDGSTSAIPLEIGLKAGKLGIPFSEAKKLVSHTTTHDSFKRLISGEVDMIFSVPISEEQQKMADEAGVKLTMVPVAKEGFVFVINGQNPVDSLTKEQIKDIYSGKITNWSQVGGNDLDILPYQRNTDSGSQNYMTKFMEDTPLSQPKTEFIAIGMGGLMDAVATYDNSAGAIGYSVYSYAAQMYANANKVKFIAIDGVKPSKATMADESYPLLSNTYIIYTDKSPKSVREFTDWAISDEGQNWVLESGYLPVNAMEIPDKYMAYEALGTGRVKAEGTKPDMTYCITHLSENDGFTVTSEGYFQVDCLKDQELQAQINEDLKKAVDSLKPYYDEKYGYEHAYDKFFGITFKAAARNGFMSFTLGYKNEDIETEPISAYYFDIYDHAVTLNYDLAEKKKIERFSDLFYKDTDFVPLVNNGLSDMISHYFTQDTNAVEKIDFAGILGEPRLFTIECVGFEADNPYFDCGPMLNFYSYKNERVLDLSPLSKYYNMRELFTEDYVNSSSYSFSDWSDSEWEEELYEEDNVIYTKYVGSRFHTDEEVQKENELIDKIQHMGEECLEKMEFGNIADTKRVYFYKLKNYWRVTNEWQFLHNSAYFDAETLERLSVEDVFGANWKKYVKDYYGDFEGTVIAYWSVPDNMVHASMIDKNGTYFTAEIPFSETNHKYTSDEENRLN